MTLRLSDGHVVRGGATLLHEANITVTPGQFVAICGPNGAGKSTALSLLDGSAQPTDGLVTLDGEPIAKVQRKALAQRRAVVPQRHQLSFPFLVHEVVAMGRAPHEGRTSPAENDAICQQAMEWLGVTPYAERNYLTLSGGERQRVMIARALAQVWEAPAEGHRYLLLDEPTAALDLKHQIALMKLLARLANEGWAVLAVLHDLALVRRWCTDVVLMKKGTTVDSGSPENLLNPENVAEIFDLDEPYQF
ncbi:MAG: heme ABC transporter ATP-binding protein [Parvularculaceae bacterium]|nr:heme ABC transporter ATP-binding protein [Parvularculaceae bacterium]